MQLLILCTKLCIWKAPSSKSEIHSMQTETKHMIGNTFQDLIQHKIWKDSTKVLDVVPTLFDCF